MSDFVQILEGFTLIMIVGYLVYKYSAKQNPLHVKLACFISWIFSFGIVVIIPLDIYYSYHLKHEYEDGEIENAPEFQNLRTAWKVYYYANQLLSWLVLPIIYSYESAGDFTFEGKLKKAIIENLWFYAIAIIIFGFILIYYVAYGTVSIDDLLIFLAALSNSVLLLMVVVLLGHGIVSIPQFYWQTRQLDSQLRYYQWKITVASENKQIAENQFESAIRTLYYVSQKPQNTQYEKYILKIFDMIPEEYKEKTYKNNCQQFTPQNFDLNRLLNEFNEMNMQKIINLNVEVRDSFMQLKRSNTQWEGCLDKALIAEDLLENKSNFDFKIRSSLWLQKKGECGYFCDNLFLLWQIKLKKYWFFILGIFTTILSIVVMLSQIANFTESQSLNILRRFLDQHYGFYTTQILVIIPLVYIMVCVNYSLFNLKTFSFLQFYSNQQTDSVALMFGSLNFARVSAPICYNFLQILNLQNTAYESVMGPMDIVPFFGEANIYFYPVILIILSFCNLFKIYKICLSHLELNDYDFNEEMDSNKLQEGKQILYKSRIERERKFLSCQSTNLSKIEGYSDMNKFSELDKLMMTQSPSHIHTDNDSRFTIRV